MSINLNFVSFTVFLDDAFGQIIVLMILTVAASETALGLAILVVFYRLRGGINVELLSLLKSSLISLAFLKSVAFFFFNFFI